MHLESIDVAMRELLAFVPQTLSRRANYNLDRINAFLDGLGKPQDTLRVVHVAGTSGKTSTAYFIRNQLQAAGRRTGLTVSPHIKSITERAHGPAYGAWPYGRLRRCSQSAEAGGPARGAGRRGYVPARRHGNV